MSSGKQPDADRVRARMDRVRRKLNRDVGDFVESSRTLADWRQYVRAQPWLAAGAAAFIGFLVVPRKIQYLTIDPEQLRDTAERQELVVASKAKVKPHEARTGAWSTLVAALITRAVIPVITRKIADAFSAQSGDRSHERPDEAAYRSVRAR